MMKRSKILLLATIIIGLGLQSFARDLCPQTVRAAINKYKAQDYIGCIQDLEEYSEKDPSNAVSYYYTGIAYMNLGLKDNAIDVFHKVSTINSVPILSSYAIQATNCMMNGITPCVYKKYSKEEIAELVQDPAGFFARKAAEPEDATPVATFEETTDIDELIQGKYPENIHPDAQRVLQETKLLQEQDRVNSELNKRNRQQNNEKKTEFTVENSSKTAFENVSDKEIANAVRVLSKAGYKFAAPEETRVASSSKSTDSKENSINTARNLYKQMAFSLNDEAMQMAMMFGGNTNRNNDSFNAMLPFLLMQEQESGNGQNGRKINPEIIKTMMMSQMMGDFSFGFDNDKDK